MNILIEKVRGRRNGVLYIPYRLLAMADDEFWKECERRGIEAEFVENYDKRSLQFVQV